MEDHDHDHERLLDARRAARAMHPSGHPKRVAAERAVRESRKLRRGGDEKNALAAALRQVISGLTQVVAALEGTVPAGVPGGDRADREIDALQCFDVPPGEGLTRAEAAAAFRQNGLDPRGFGSWVRRGLVTRDGDSRRLTDKGRQWIAARES